MLSFSPILAGMKAVILALCVLIYNTPFSQALGGYATFNFLKLPNTPQLTALGGINISQSSNDLGMVFNNPALLKVSMHAQVNAVFNNFYSDINVYHLSGCLHHDKLKTNFSAGLNFFDYGRVSETDPSGNILGKFHPVDWVLQVSASRNYLSKWNYGASIKYISSNYGQFRSNAVAMDIGILFTDSADLITASLVAKNMGTQIKSYRGSGPEDLPFELQAGITKRLKDAPLAFSLTAQKLQHFDISYDDTLFNNQNGFGNGSNGFGMLLDHLVLAATVYVTDKIEVYTGYNFLRRRDLNTGNTANGMNGFSLGAGVLLGKLDIRYARAYYQDRTAYNQFGLNIKMNELGIYRRH